MQKYPQVTEWFASTRKMLAIMFLLRINFLISLGISSTPKLSKYAILFLFQNKAIQCVPTSAYLSRFLIYAPSFIF